MVFCSDILHAAVDGEVQPCAVDNFVRLDGTYINLPFVWQYLDLANRQHPERMGSCRH